MNVKAIEVDIDLVCRVSRGTYKVITTDGEVRTVRARPTIGTIQCDISADTLDTVNLRSDRGAITGIVMMVDDAGIYKELPVNDIATRIYHRQCRPGTTNQIHGDVVLTTSARRQDAPPQWRAIDRSGARRRSGSTAGT